MENYNHKCIKCKNSYSDTDPEPYLCPPCIDIKNAIAKEVDAKMSGRVSRKKSQTDLEVYDEICKARGSRFVNIKDLGISL